MSGEFLYIFLLQRTAHENQETFTFQGLCSWGSQPSIHHAGQSPGHSARGGSICHTLEPISAQKSQVPNAGSASGVSSRSCLGLGLVQEPEEQGGEPLFCQRPPGCLQHCSRATRHYPLSVSLLCWVTLLHAMAEPDPKTSVREPDAPHAWLRKYPLSPSGDDSPDPWVSRNLANPHTHFWNISFRWFR